MIFSTFCGFGREEVSAAYPDGGKAAFATVDWYSELMNWRRSLAKYRPTTDQQQVMAYLEEKGGELRKVTEYARFSITLTAMGGEALIERLRGVDPDSLTPREALSLLYELKKEADSHGG